MKHRHRRIVPALCLTAGLLLLLAGCMDNLSKALVESSIRHARHVTCSFRVTPLEDAAETKSSFAGNVVTVSNWTLLQFEGGVLVAKYYQASSADMSNVEVTSGRTYNWYALANVGDVRSSFTVGTTQETAMATWAVTGVDMTELTALPMAGKVESLNAATAGSVMIYLAYLKRLGAI